MSEQINLQENGIPLKELITPTLCPRCQSNKTVRNGTRKENVKHICRQCGKTFSTTTGTTIHRLQKRQQFIQYAECIQECMTIRQAAKHIGISVSTSFAWRHKHLIAQSKPSKENKQAQIVTLGILQTHYSEKGKRIKSKQKMLPIKSLIILDHFGIQTIQTANTAKDITRHIEETGQQIKQITAEKKQILTNALKHISIDRIQAYSKTNKVMKSKLTETKQKIDKWLEKFRGVATKYLQQYWNWYCMSDRETMAHEILTNTISTNDTYVRYRCMREK